MRGLQDGEVLFPVSVDFPASRGVHATEAGLHGCVPVLDEVDHGRWLLSARQAVDDVRPRLPESVVVCLYGGVVDILSRGGLLPVVGSAV